MLVVIIVISSTVGDCSQQKETVILGVETSLLQAAVWVAENKGYFEGNRNDYKVTKISTNPSSSYRNGALVKHFCRVCLPEQAC